MKEPNLEPRIDKWEEVTKPRLIEEKVFEICDDIARRYNATNYPEIIELIYEYVEDNFANYIEVDHGDA